MKIGGRAYRTIWPEGGAVVVIDQTLLPHRFRDPPADDCARTRLTRSGRWWCGARR